jgi:hypothetical protein
MNRAQRLKRVFGIEIEGCAGCAASIALAAPEIGPMPTRLP